MLSNNLIETWLNNGKEISPHLKSSLEKLSPEHISGISLAQLDSPMMKQFRIAKEEAPDALLFFRMGAAFAGNATNRFQVVLADDGFKLLLHRQQRLLEGFLLGFGQYINLGFA